MDKTLLSKQKNQVTIIGASPSGSIAASLLKKHDIDVIVIEKSILPRFSIRESLLLTCIQILNKAGMLSAVKTTIFHDYVEGWYSEEFQQIVLHKTSKQTIKQMISSIWAGYAWDNNNPFATVPVVDYTPYLNYANKVDP